MTDVIHNTLEERRNEYGSFAHVSNTTQYLKDMLRMSPSWSKLELEERESLDMICSKIARIVCGRRHQADSWKDISGYAMLAYMKVSKDLTWGKE